MSTVQGTASPRAPRGKHVQNATAQSQSQNGKQSQRRPRGNRANNTNRANQHMVSPNRTAPVVGPILAESVVFSSEGARNPKKHTQSQPSMDRVYPPSGTQASMTDSEGAHNNPAATPAKIQGAYAGPTFHASPAPSTLPKPKFLSKSVPAKTRVGPPTPPPEDSSDSANSPSPSHYASPSRAPIPVPQRKEDSPLDLLFKADRAERAQRVGGSPASNGLASPPSASKPQHYKHDSYHSLNAPFPIELDGQSKTTQICSPPVASLAASRSVTDPNKIPQLKDASKSPNSNDVMQDLLNRLSMSQKKPSTRSPPGPNVHAPSDPQSRHETPSPSMEGRVTARSASGPSTPAATSHEPPDFFYGNRNLSPLFKAAKNDTSKRNSGLRTEITADSPLVAQGFFQDFPSVTSPPTIDPNTFSRQHPGHVGQVPVGPRRGSVPYVQTYPSSPNNRRKTPGKQTHQPRPDSYPGKPYFNGPNSRPGRAGSSDAPASSVKKPATSMMSFVPASVAAKQHSSSMPPSLPPMRTSTPPDTLALEQDLKRLLNLKMTGDAPGVR